MKNVLLLLAIIMLSPLLIASSCKQTTTDNNPCKGVMCTMMFAMVTVEVVTSDGNPVVLDEVYTIRSKDGTKLQMEQHAGENGSYVILDDSYQKVLANSSEPFRFIGIKNGVKVVDEHYTIGADCCHVSRNSGTTRIVLD